MIKKADIFLFLFILIIGTVSSLFIYGQAKDGREVEITVAGDLYGVYDLDEDREIVIKQHGHLNKVIIKDGTVSMDFSDCKNQVCVNTGKISKSSQAITCLPNKVMVTVTGGDYDATTR